MKVASSYLCYKQKGPLLQFGGDGDGDGDKVGLGGGGQK